MQAPGDESAGKSPAEAVIDHDGIRLEKRGMIAMLTLNRPQVRNAMDGAMRKAMLAALDEVRQDDRIRALVLTGAGTGFCAGGDISVMRQRMQTPPGRIGFEGWQGQAATYQVIETLYGLPKPAIAAVNGPAAGVGCDLALCCDFILACSSASFSMSFILRGLVPDAGAYFLPRRVGIARAKEMVYSGRRVAADEALRIGLVDRLTASGELLCEAQKWAIELAEQSPAAMALTKELLNQSLECDAYQSFARARQAQALCLTTGEHRAAVTAFLDKSLHKP